MTTETNNPLLQHLPSMTTYLGHLCKAGAPIELSEDFTVCPLAQGEYNLNYLVTSNGNRYVLRLNMGTQINRPDQIVYEFNALKLLEKSRVTPAPYYVDDSREHLDRGVSIMEYLPGEHLDYQRDSLGAAKTFSIIHQLEVNPVENHLIVEQEPLSLIHDECSRLLGDYFSSELAVPSIRSYLLDLLAWAGEQTQKEQYYQQDPWNSIVNTEVNSGNFIVNRDKGKVHLIDWEMPRWGDPSSDLCHFYSPLTTLWKTDFRFNPDQKDAFIEEYKKNIRCQRLRNTLEDRLRLKMPFVLLRGISWSAMGWVAYRTGTIQIRNEDTARKLNQYMNLDFIRSCFDPYFQQ